jgi:two-component system response regulator AtoC
VQGMTPNALHSLCSHSWPGNVRELENAIEHAVIVESGPVILPVSLPMNLAEPRRATGGKPVSTEPGLRDKLNVVEREILIEALARANGIKKRAAAMLGVDARNLPYLLKKHHLDQEPNPDVSVH